MRTRLVVSILTTSVLLATVGGCANSYVTPRAAADLSLFSNEAAVASAAAPGSPGSASNIPAGTIYRTGAGSAITTGGVEDGRPLASTAAPMARFPASVAVARVQAGNYHSRHAATHGEGRFTVITTRDVEDEADLERLAKLPQLAGLAPLSTLVIPQRLNRGQDLRDAAAMLHTDMLLVYTFNTVFSSDDKVVPLSIITLGLFPGTVANVTCTASAVLVDTRTGFLYGTAEHTEKTSQLANAWNDKSAVDQARKRAEREAFTGLTDSLETMWSGVVARYGAGSR